jgi:hypothetical protein
VRRIVEGLYAAEARDLLAQLRELAGAQPQFCRALLAESPALAQSVAHMVAAVSALHTATPAYSAARQHHLALQPPPPQQQQQQPQPQQQPQKAQQAPAAQASAPQQQMQQQQQQTGASDDEVTLLRRILAMSDAEVAAMEPDTRDSAMQMRFIMRTPPEQLSADLMAMRRQLEALLSAR